MKVYYKIKSPTPNFTHDLEQFGDRVKLFATQKADPIDGEHVIDNIQVL